MYRSAIAFLVDVLPTPDVFTQFTHLGQFFHCSIFIENLTKKRIANVSEKLALLSLGLSKADLCKINFLGKDAELAAFVFSAYVQECFTFINSYPNKKLPEYFSRAYPTLVQKLNITHYYYDLEITYNMSKLDVLAEIVDELSQSKQVSIDIKSAWLDSFYEREAYSSTAIGHHIALPHIMHESIKEPMLIIARLSSLIDWNSQLGDIDMIIAIMMPKPAKKSEIIAMVRLTRFLLDDIFCSKLREISEPEILHTYLLDKMRA